VLETCHCGAARDARSGLCVRLGGDHAATWLADPDGSVLGATDWASELGIGRF